MIKYTRNIKHKAIISDAILNYDYKAYYRFSKSFFGSLIKNGKKSKALDFYLEIFKTLKLSEKAAPSLIFLVAMIKISPVVFAQSIRLGSGTQQIPAPISERKQTSLGVRWIIKMVNDNKKSISPKVVAEILIDALYDKGAVITKKKTLYKMFVENKHLRRFFK